jgi:hypothetical protein
MYKPTHFSFSFVEAGQVSQLALFRDLVGLRFLSQGHVAVLSDSRVLSVYKAAYTLSLEFVQILRIKLL